VTRDVPQLMEEPKRVPPLFFGNLYIGFAMSEILAQGRELSGEFTVRGLLETAEGLVPPTRLGGKIRFLAGIDAQHTLQEKDAEGVRNEVRFLMDIFDGPDGGMCIGAGNGIVPGTPLCGVYEFVCLAGPNCG
jgi:hypothetical protein